MCRKAVRVFRDPVEREPRRDTAQWNWGGCAERTGRHTASRACLDTLRAVTVAQLFGGFDAADIAATRGGGNIALDIGGITDEADP